VNLTATSSEEFKKAWFDTFTVICFCDVVLN